MINVLLPSMGKTNFFKDMYFPKPIIEINGKTMLEIVQENFASIKDKKMIYVFSKDNCNQFHLDDSVKIMNPEASVLSLKNETAGALCTALIAIEFINNNRPLIIANSDQIIDVNYEEVLSYFQEEKADAGVITFKSIHPRWSYIKSCGKNVIEVAEKRPLSAHAIAGFYYYKKGYDFIEAAKRVILKGSSIEGKYYISSSFNELILLNKNVIYYEVKPDAYHSFYSPEKIKKFEGKRI
jgi:dTDP-glucose pyrophosphorylase